MSTLSTHVLDTGMGRPARGIHVSLEHDGAIVGSGVTDADGRVGDLAKEGSPFAEGSYLLRFAVEEYFAGNGRDSFYAEVVIAFKVSGGDEHYHVPLLLGPFGYTTYRGS